MIEGVKEFGRGGGRARITGDPISKLPVVTLLADGRAVHKAVAQAGKA